MQAVVQTLEGLARRVELVVSMADVEKQVQTQLKRVAKTAKIAGFRPGKAPLSLIERSHGAGIRYDALNTQVGQSFEKFVSEAKLRVAGQPTLAVKENKEGEAAPEDATEGALTFTATFEVYPEVALPDLAGLAIKRVVVNVGEAEVEHAIDVLRKQRVRYEPREGRAAQDGDRVQVDFAGTIDGVPFDGGKAEDFPVLLGAKRMLPEFEAALAGMKAGETKLFPLAFPADYQGKDVAGKTAEFTVTVKEVAEAVLPEVDAEFAKSLGQKEGDVAALREDIKQNVEREAKLRAQARTKSNVMDALAAAASFDVPKALVANDVARSQAAAREELKQRGVPNADSVPLPEDLFTATAERRVKLGLLVAEFIKTAQLQAKPEQVRARIEELAASYEQPAQLINYYLTDRERRAEIEAIVLEDNVVEHVLAGAQVTDETVPFTELMEGN